MIAQIAVTPPNRPHPKAVRRARTRLTNTLTIQMPSLLGPEPNNLRSVLVEAQFQKWRDHLTRIGRLGTLDHNTLVYYTQRLRHGIDVLLRRNRKSCDRLSREESGVSDDLGGLVEVIEFEDAVYRVRFTLSDFDLYTLLHMEKRLRHAYTSYLAVMSQRPPTREDDDDFDDDEAS